MNDKKGMTNRELKNKVDKDASAFRKERERDHRQKREDEKTLLEIDQLKKAKRNNKITLAISVIAVVISIVMPLCLKYA